MQISAAPAELVSFVSDFLLSDMVPALRAAGITGREEAIAHLRARGFGEASTAALVDQALALAAVPRRG